MPGYEIRPPGTESGRAGHRAAVGTAVVAGAFSLIVCALLVHNDWQRRHADPLNSAELKQLKASLLQDPRSAAIKEEIRALDLRLRQEYFGHRAFSRVGAHLLLGGVVVLLAALKSAGALRKRVPMPQPDLDRADPGAGAAPTASWSVAGFGLVAGSALLWLAVLPRSPESREFWAAVEEMKTSTAVPRAYPSPEEVRKNWSRFRGPGGLGVSAYTNVPSFWNGHTGEGIRWKAPVPLPGENSPVIWGDRLFLTGATAERREVYCFDVDSGGLSWKQVVPRLPGSPSEPPGVMEETGFAAPTAVTDGRRVYAVFANGDLAAFEVDGKPAWARSLGLPENPYGHSSSLAMYRNLLLVLLDQGARNDSLSVVMALEAHSGETVWQTQRPVPHSWASPIVIDAATGPQLVTCADPWVMAYDLGTGQELWRVDCLMGDVAPSPVFANGLVFAVQSGAYLAAIRPDGRGDVTGTHLVWTAEDGLPDIPSPASNGELVFLVTTYGGILTCYDAGDGKMVWEQELDTSFESSPTVVGERVYLMSTDGVMHIFAARRVYEELGRAELGEAASTCPAFQDGRIYIRGKENLYCMGGA